ncbi:MAG: acyl-CoA dehydrogenase family protein [Chloroflexota bacterium]|nr:acyl-CoA dehydrogenase family protein [Chloroflexota bacterium]
MNFQLTKEQETFREEIRQFLKTELPADWHGIAGPTMLEQELDREEVWEMYHKIAKKLAERGWIAMAWPKEYGGQERSHVEQAVFHEEMAYYRAPGINAIGVVMIAPTIIVCGTDEQKKKHLLPIANAESFWCEGFSEPGAGSDLASIKTRAEEKDDAFYISGQKVWTTFSHRSDWCGMLARTDPDAPKHKGISFFLVDMNTPGVEAVPMQDASTGYELTEVFFDNVRVPKENLLGGLNDGWNVAMTLLSFERSGSGFIGTGRRLLDDIAGYAREATKDKNLSVYDHIIRHRLANSATKLEIARLLSYRIAWMQEQKLIPEAEAGMSKVFATEALQELTNVGLQVAGLYGQVREGSKWAQLRGSLWHSYVCSLGIKIAAGTNEVQRNIIAQRGLGMPR